MTGKERREAKEALLQVIDLAGGQYQLRDMLQLKSQGSISNMVKRGLAARDQVIKMEALTGVSRSRLRPDYYPPERP